MKIFKYIVCIILALVFAAGICACSKNSEKTNDAKLSSQSETTVKTTAVYYDKYGNACSSLNELKYYDKNDNTYTYDDSASELFFVNKQGKKFSAEKCFVDKNGTFIYDEKGEIIMNSDYVSASDKKGNAYYPAATVRWTDDGSMVNFFGLGQDIN